jgi:predicted ATPase/DNA-binding SARP family transcriptional activator
MDLKELRSMRLIVNLLGPFQAFWEKNPEAPIEWPRKQTQQLFKILVCQRGVVLSQDLLIDRLFPDLPLDRAARNLHKRISELRKVLEPHRKRGQESQFVQSPSQGNYLFVLESPCVVDLENFDSLLRTAENANHDERWGDATTAYSEAAELYRGEFLPEDLYEDWTQDLRHRSREAYYNCLTHWVENEMSARDFQAAILLSQKVLQAELVYEKPYELLMRAYYYLNQSQKAIDLYEKLVDLLKHKLDTTPSEEIQQTIHAIRNKSLPTAEDAIPNNLPAKTSSFVGRSDEIIAIQKSFSDSRLLTLTGIGGAGKTRLSLKLAMEFLEDFPDGVWFIELAATLQSDLIPQQIARILKIHEDLEQDLLEKICEFLSTRKCLIILDNCEHLIEESASVADKLLKYSSGLKIIASSREPLNIQGELIWQILPLSVPDPERIVEFASLKQNEAIRLFTERAQSVHPSFRLDDQNIAHVASLCFQLDGLPLAIELAATQMRSLSIEQIVERLGDRFALLGTEFSNRPQHQLTLKAAMDWSYELLDDREKMLFNKLSVFRGGFSLDAVETICADDQIPRLEIIMLMRQLIDKSLIISFDRGSQKRYDLLETVRQYGAAQLHASGNQEEIYLAHLQYFSDLATRNEMELKEDLESETSNFRVALRWSLNGSAVEEGGKLLDEIKYFWYYLVSQVEGCQWYELALSRISEVSEEIAARIYLGAGIFGTNRDPYEKSLELLEKAEDRFRQLDDKLGIIEVLQLYGFLYTGSGQYDKVSVVYEEGLALCKEINDDVYYRTFLHNYGVCLTHTGKFELARAKFDEALEISRKLESNLGVGWTNADLALINVYEGKFEEAEILIQEAVEIGKLYGSKRDIADAYHARSKLALAQAFHDKALEWVLESIKLSSAQGPSPDFGSNLDTLARVLFKLDEFEHATLILGAADGRRTKIGAKLPPIELPDHEKHVTLLQQKLGEVPFDEIYQRGQRTSFNEIVEFAISIYS